MLNYIAVDGFKSLIDFEMCLQPGLNILVGPNGSGKTNIVSFFEFLGNLQEMNLSDAICSAGGAGTLFTKEGEDRYRPNMKCCVTGNIHQEKKRVLFYRYSFNIGIKEKFESIIYHSQRLQLKYKTSDSKPGQRLKDLDLDIEMTVGNDKDRPSITIHALDRRKIRSDYVLHRRVKTKANAIRLLEDMIRDYIGVDDSLIRAMRYHFDDWRFIYHDLRGGKIFNIVPSRVRIPEDSANPPGIGKDGSGLYATLYYIMKREQRFKYRRRWIRRPDTFDYDVGTTTLKSILLYTKLANDSIVKLDIINNPFDNQLQIRIWIQGEKEDTVLPLSAMSDGTIKWLSLITIILTTRSIYSIEEPENYLHPLMQAEILNVMRSTMRAERFIILSTHSETILNNATPEEVVVISFKDGVTTAKKPENSEELTREINKTGFGLGYYYIAGSLDDE